MALTFPSSPVDGQLYVDTGTGNRYIYDSGKGLWKYASNNVGMTVGTAPPPSASVAPGAMWYNTNTGRTFILYDDGDSRQWVENVPAVGSFDSSTVAGYANAAVLPAVTPAFDKANTALANTSGVWFGGNLSVSGTFGVGTSTAYGKFNVVGGRSFQIANNEVYALGLGYHSSTGGYYYLGASNSSTPDLIFSQVGGSERMRLTNAGDLGIGTNSPQYKLDVVGKGRIGFEVSQGNPNSTDITANAHTLLSGTGGNFLAIGQYPGTFSQWIQSSFSNPSTATYSLILNPLGGNVGIGTSSPTGRLDVASRGITKGSMPAGSILQVVSARNGDFFSTTSTSWVDITGLSVNITPTSSTSKVFVMVSFGRATTSAYNLDYACSIRVLANGSDALNINGNSSGSREKVAMVINGLAFNADHSPGGFGCSGLESPGTTSTVTYKVQVRVQSPAFNMNGSPNNADSGSTYHGRSASSITVWEIAQ